MTYAITGIQAGLGPNGQVPIRREIDEWWFSKEKNDLYQRSLFVYALHEFMAMDPSKQLSYFGVSGIHGLPLVPWDTKVEKDDNYCVHGTPLFPPWHRPYMLLYEQRLYEIMIDLIPRTFIPEDQNDMINAANTWRLPFWDWAEQKPDWGAPNDKNRYGPNVPYLLTVPKVQVKTKTGVATVDNPMWKFVMPVNGTKSTMGDYGITNVGGEPFGDCKATSKHPSTNNPQDPEYVTAWVDGDEQNWQTVTGELRGSEGVDSNTLPETVYRLFVEENFPSYNAFATDGWVPGQGPSEYSSLESVHGQVHVYTGGQGQMSTVPVAAFDPIFWMHHCNIDRLFAIYQELYPEKYVERITVGGQTVGPNDKLAPFHQDNRGSSWTPSKCRYQNKNQGYTYVDLQKWLPKYQTNGKFDLAKFQQLLRAEIDQKYSTTGQAVLRIPQNDNIAAFSLAKPSAPEQAPQVKHVQPVAKHEVHKPDDKTKQVVISVAELAEPNSPVVQPGGPDHPAHPTQPGGPKLPVPAHIPDPAVPEKWEENDYVVNVLYDRFALGGNPYLVRIFLGDVPPGPPFYFADTPTQVGLVYNFSSPPLGRGTGEEGCQNCARQREAGHLSTGQLVLTDYLAEWVRKGLQGRDGERLGGLGREEVGRWLRKELHWRISDAKDRIVPKEDMPSLKVSVAVGKATHYAEKGRFSRYEDYEVLWDITSGRRAGAERGDLG